MTTAVSFLIGVSLFFAFVFMVISSSDFQILDIKTTNNGREIDGNDKTWERNFFDEDISITHYVYPHDHARFVYVIDPVYVYTDSGMLHALNITNGATMWKKDFGLQFRLDPFLLHESLYIFLEGKVLSVDPLTGEENWQAEVPGLSSYDPWFSPNYLGLVSAGREVYCFNPAGELLWKFRPGFSFSMSPQFTEDWLVVGDSSGNLYCYDLAEGKIDEEKNMDAPQLWFREKPCLEFQLAKDGYREGDSVYILEEDEFLAVRAHNGSLRWSVELETELIYSPLLYRDAYNQSGERVEAIYLVPNSREVWKLRDNGSLNWSYTLEDPLTLPPRISVMKSFSADWVYLYLSTEDQIHVINCYFGTEMENFKVRPGAEFLTLSPGQVILGGENWVIAYDSFYASPADYGTDSTPGFEGVGLLVAALLGLMLYRRRRSGK